RTDLWSLGSALYCALTGRAPHLGLDSVGKLILAICSGPARPLRELAPWVRPEVADVVHRALAIDREERFASADAIASPRASRPRRAFVMAAGAAVVLALAAGYAVVRPRAPAGRAVAAAPGP